jgi:hypothetical protein
MTPLVSELADRAEITSLVSRYFSAIGDKRLDRATMEAVFTASGPLTRPNGPSLVGPEAIAAGQSQSFAASGQPTTSAPTTSSTSTGSARLRANLIAMHLWANQERDPNTLQTHFLAGGVPRPRGTHQSGMAAQ